jgi:hypothetical protein
VLANIFADFRDTPDAPPFTHVPKISLFCSAREAKDRLKRIEDLGIDDALLVVPSGDPGQLETIAGLTS